MKKADRQQFAKKQFEAVAPAGWREVEGQAVGQGGQSGVCVVERDDGARGVFRCLLEDADETAIKRFHRELSILTNIEHPNIIRLLDWTRDESSHWYVSELGNSFEDFWNKQRNDCANEPIQLVRRAVELCTDISKGLAAVHSRRIVHRDIKPANIVMVPASAPSLPAIIDFGVAHVAEDGRLTKTHEAVGNARYSPSAMAYRGEEVPPWYDVFQLSQVFIWMLQATRSLKHYWSRPLDWRYVAYDPELPEDVLASIHAITAVCSQQTVAPASGGELVTLFSRKFFADAETRVLGSLNHAKINKTRRTQESLQETAMVADLAELEAAVPIAMQAVQGLIDAFVEIESAGKGVIPVYLAFERKPSDVLTGLMGRGAETHLVICRLSFGGEASNVRQSFLGQTFSVTLNLIAYRPSKASTMTPRLPEGMNICAFRLQRSGRPGRMPPLVHLLTLTRTAGLVLWDHQFQKGEPTTLNEVINIVRGWCEDQAAWVAIS